MKSFRYFTSPSLLDMATGIVTDSLGCRNCTLKNWTFFLSLSEGSSLSTSLHSLNN